MAELGKETCLGLSASSSSEESGKGENPSSGSKRQNPSGFEAGSKRQKEEEQQDVYGFDKDGYFITPSPFRGLKGVDYSRLMDKYKGVNPSSICAEAGSKSQKGEENLDTEEEEDMYRFDEDGYFITPSPFRKKGLDYSRFKNKPVNYYALSCLRPLTEGEKLDFHHIFGPRGNDPPLPVIKPLPGDEDIKWGPLTASMVDRVLLKRDPDAKCLHGDYLSPYCRCSKDANNGCSPILTRRTIEAYPVLPVRALEKHRKRFIPIWLAYYCQTRQSHFFDIDDHPGSSFGASVAPLLPYKDFSGKLELMMELSNRAVQEYNDKDCHIYKYKYKVLKIEKVNFSASGRNYEYWMTVKVVNLTLATPIETFQIHAGISAFTEEKVIYCCRPKEEMIDGVSLPNCDVCFRKVRDEERPYCDLYT